MKPTHLLFAVACMVSGFASAQNVGIGIAAPLEKLHVAGSMRTDNASILWPGVFAAAAAPNINIQYSTARITLVAGVQANAITYTATADEGQELYISNEDDNPATFVGATIPPNEARTFIYTNGVWRPTFSPGGGSAWLLLGNAGTVDGTNFLGTTDNIPLNFRVNNEKAGKIDHLLLNTFMGYQAGNVTTGMFNAGFGYQALSQNSTGTQNSAFGSGALLTHATGTLNTAIGSNSMYFNSTGGSNTAIGAGSLNNADVGNSNTALGRDALYQNSNGSFNSAGGWNAMYTNIAGSNGTAFGTNAMRYTNNQPGAFTNNNTAVGYEALRGSLAPASNTGNNNTAVGNQSLLNNSSGGNNVAIGNLALQGNTTGGGNVAIGHLAGNANSTGNFNVAIGRQAGQNNTQGGNVFVGDLAGQGNTSGSYNVCIGMWSGNVLNGATASANTFVGYMTGFANTTAGGNTFIGNNAGINANTGGQNTYLGCQAGQNHTTSANNTFVGWRAGFYTVGSATGGNNVFMGFQAGDNNATGTGNVAIGYDADLTGSAFTNAIAIGNTATVNASNKIRMGNAAITAADIQVAWTVVSDKTQKSDIRDDVPGLNLITRLNPVTYYYNSHLETSGKENATRYTGLLAQDVDATLQELGIVSSLVTRPAADGSGSWGIRYSDLVMPLINAVQEQQQTIEELKAETASQASEMEKMKADIEMLKAMVK